MRIGITGNHGFIGSHVFAYMRSCPNTEVIHFERIWFDQPDELDTFVAQCDAVIHLAGMNRGPSEEVYSTNIGVTQKLIESFKRLQWTGHVIFSSSTRASVDDSFGRSKQECTEALRVWATTNAGAFTNLTIPNVFGEGGKPFYNSVVATFCYQLTHGQQPTILVDNITSFIHINSLIGIIIDCMDRRPDGWRNVAVNPDATCTIGELLSLLSGFKDDFIDKRMIPALIGRFQKDLFSTFISYMDSADLLSFPTRKEDHRGSLLELHRHASGGQVFLSFSNPGVIRGNHFHRRKIERFFIVKGEARVRMRRITSNQVHEFLLSSRQPGVLEIPILHVHNLENCGSDDLIMLFWTDELFNPEDADTYQENV